VSLHVPFPIRELVLVTVIVAVGVAWWLDRHEVTRRGAARAAAIRSHSEALQSALKKARPVTTPFTGSYTIDPASNTIGTRRRQSVGYLPLSVRSDVDWGLADKPIPP